jgi:maltose-binding protein MalE
MFPYEKQFPNLPKMGYELSVTRRCKTEFWITPTDSPLKARKLKGQLYALHTQNFEI